MFIWPAIPSVVRQHPPKAVGRERVFFFPHFKTELNRAGLTQEIVFTLTRCFNYKRWKSGKVLSQEEQPRAAGALCVYGNQVHFIYRAGPSKPELRNRDSAKGFNDFVESAEKKGETRTSSMLGRTE